MAAANVVAGGVTIYTTKVEEVRAKKLTVITQPQASKNWDSGPKDSKIVDLLRVEKRLNVDGYIDATDKAAFRNLMDAGGVFTLTYNGENFDCNVEKFTIMEIPEDKDTVEPVHYDIKLSVVFGEDL